ncbi:unnamed protein product [Lupinus luteus]|uniref:Uncharacterized protein n=1 Tax=Lupinus luteus TaxID=3873 RepID=A0AAV1XAE3_LUPLU
MEGFAMPSSTPINDELNAHNHSITVGDDLHGDWLVVTRRRRNGKSSKGGNDMLATDIMASKSNTFAALSMAGTTLPVSNVPGGGNVINGAIIGETLTNNKKRIRTGNKSDTDQEVGVILNDFMGVNESLNTLPRIKVGLKRMNKLGTSFMQEINGTTVMQGLKEGTKMDGLVNVGNQFGKKMQIPRGIVIGTRVDNAPLHSQSHMNLVNDPSRKENDVVCLAPNSQSGESHPVQEEDEQSMDCH